MAGSITTVRGNGRCILASDDLSISAQRSALRRGIACNSEILCPLRNRYGNCGKCSLHECTGLELDRSAVCCGSCRGQALMQNHDRGRSFLENPCCQMGRMSKVIARPLSHDEPVQLYCRAAQERDSSGPVRHPAKHHPRRTGLGACIPILRAAPGRYRDGAAGAHDDVRKSTQPNEARTEILSVRRTCKACWNPAPGAYGSQKLLGLSDKTATLFQRPLEDGLLPRPAASGVPHPHRSALRPSRPRRHSKAIRCQRPRYLRL